MPQPETKHITTKATVTEDGDGQGLIEAVFSTFGNVDSTGDVVLKSTFTDGQEVPMVWSHNWDMPIGKGIVHVTPKQAVFKGQLWLDTEDGLQAFRKIRNAGNLQEFSWGFQVTDAEPGVVDGQDVRLIKGAELFEVSPVLVGANRETRLLSIKAADVLDPPTEDPEPEPDPDTEEKAVWTTAYVNSLPDSSFAVILPGGEKDAEGKTTPRELRKLPHHAADGSLDTAHLRNALSREPQTDMPDPAHARAHAHLQRHMGGKGDESDHEQKDAESSEPVLSLTERARLLSDAATALAEATETDPLTDAETRKALDGLRTQFAKACGQIEARLKRTDLKAQAEPRNLYAQFLQLDALHRDVPTMNPVRRGA